MILFRRLSRVFSGLLLAFTALTLRAQTVVFTPGIYNIAPWNSTGTMSGPQGIAVDSHGSVYVTDTNYNMLRKIDATGTASVVAGYYGAAYSGDNGLAAEAFLYRPSGVAVDASDNVYIADTTNFAVRRIDAVTGIITTVAGGHGSSAFGDGGLATAAGFVAPSGVAVDTSGNIFVLDNGVVRKITASTGIIQTYAGGGSAGVGDGGRATAATLVSPVAIAVDTNGDLYIGDSGSYRIRKVTAVDGLIWTVAGNGTYGNSPDGAIASTAPIGYPYGIAVDAAGVLYFSDGAANTVRTINGGLLGTLAGNGLTSTTVQDGTPAINNPVSFPNGIAVDARGTVYVVARNANKAFRIVQHPEQFPFSSVGMAVPSQRLLVRYTGSSYVTISSVLLSGDFSIGASGTNANPCANGTYLFSDTSGFCTLDIEYTPSASGIRTASLTITTSGDTAQTTLTSTALSNTMQVTANSLYTVAGKYNGTVGVRGDGDVATAATLGEIDGIAIDRAGNVFFTEFGYCQVRRMDAATGILSTIAGVNPDTCTLNSTVNDVGDEGQAELAKLYYPTGLTFDKDGNLYIADRVHAQIRRIDTFGIIHKVAGATGGCKYAGDGALATAASLCTPDHIQIDSSGNLYFTDMGGNVIRKIDTNGIITTVAGIWNSGVGSWSADGPALTTHLNAPTGLVLDSTEKYLYFNDSGNYIVRRLDIASATITTIAGSHNGSGYSGDGGLANNALLGSNMADLVRDASDNLYIADGDNYVVRRIDANGIITTVAGNKTAGSVYDGDGRRATEETLSAPQALAVDLNGNLLIADRDYVIRKLSPNASIDFGSTALNSTSTAQTLTISNLGYTALTFATPALQIAGDFAQSSGGTCSLTSSLAVGTSCTVNLTFTPTAAGQRFGTLWLYNQGAASPHLVALRGTVAAAPTNQLQTISFPSPGNFTYGQAARLYTATSTSGLPVTVTVQSGPGFINSGYVGVTGVGTVVLAANQAGNATYAAAPTVTQTITVSPAVLNVTPKDVSMTYGSVVPTIFAVDITGYVNGDTSSVVSGSAAVTTAATSTSPVGPYAITASQGTLAASNYSFVFTPGTLTITRAAQNINFGPVRGNTWGDGPITLSATATSGLAVTFSVVSGPGTISGNTLTPTGAGSIVVKASQAGDGNYFAATDVSQTITIGAKNLVVVTDDKTMQYGSSTPAFTGSLSGFVFGDTAAIVTGSVSYSISSTPPLASGTYQIRSSGNLAAPNYIIVYSSGTLTVTNAPLTVTANAATRAYGAPDPTYTSTITGARNGDTFTTTYTVGTIATTPPGDYLITPAPAGANLSNYDVQIFKGTLTITKATGTISVLSSASQINLNGSVTLTATFNTTSSGTPTGTVQFTNVTKGTVLGTATWSSSRTVALTTTTLPTGSNQIAVSYAGDTNFAAPSSAMATVAVGTFTLKASPSSLTIVQGASGSAQITMTPTDGYTGTLSLSCGDLPRGVSCSFSPSTLVATGNNAAASTTLTVSTTSTRVALDMPHNTSRLALALLLPLLLVKRRKLLRAALPLFVAAIVIMGATGCGTPLNPNATPLGTANVTVTPFIGSVADPTQQLALSITVQAQ